MPQWMPDINANNEMLVINLMILMQSSNKQIASHIAHNSCIAVEYFTYLASELSIFVGAVPYALGTIDMVLNNFQ